MDKLKIIKGDDKIFDLVFKKDGVEFNITDYIVFFTVKSDVTLPDDKAEIKKEITQHFDPIKGVTQLVINSDDTSDLNAGKYYFDFQVKSPENKIASTLMGDFYIIQDVTERVESDND